MILFHYNLSPYAEKIRLLMGYTNSAWQSVLVPPMPPRKGLDILAGGYRRIPVAQQGADIFCDTRIITAELAQQVGNSDLSVHACNPDVAEFAERIENENFMPAVRAVPPGPMLKAVLKNHNVITAFKLVRDRAKMGKAATKRSPGAKRSASILAYYLLELNDQLTQDYLFGAQPTIADFSAYHHVWFYHDLGGQPLPDNLPALSAWVARMHAFGHGRREEKTMRYALEEAKQSSPRAMNAS
ncbi:MAG: glutathione S-transferase family protein, partial [Gammaproteobacteria bacterium]|nr:glutathione S-transferase family protein [Gammaproteobacteria bacterium]